MKGITVSINKKSKIRSGRKGPFSAQAFLDSAGVARKIKELKRGRSSTLKFRKLGFIRYNGGLQINTSLSVVLHNCGKPPRLSLFVWS